MLSSELADAGAILSIFGEGTDVNSGTTGPAHIWNHERSADRLELDLHAFFRVGIDPHLQKLEYRTKREPRPASAKAIGDDE
jgi:hypothetical protein